MTTPWAEIERIINEANDYNSTAEAAVKAAVLAFNYAADNRGLTGFQGSWAALKAYAEIMHYDCPIAMFKADDLLYPQYDLPARLAKWMEECKPWLAEQAREKLDSKTFAVPHVEAHWRKLAADGTE